VNEPVMLKDHTLHLRRLVIKPGSSVPWHSHTNRPAIVYIIVGTIAEYRSTCKTPIVYKAGESVAEVKGTSHWWKNTAARQRSFCCLPTCSTTRTELLGVPDADFFKCLIDDLSLHRVWLCSFALNSFLNQYLPLLQQLKRPKLPVSMHMLALAPTPIAPLQGSAIRHFFQI
jgi:quercetin dioxygenase-like cupin family protein